MINIIELLKKIINENFRYGEYGVCDFNILIPYLNKKLVYKLPDNPNTVIVFIFPYYVKIGQHNISRYAVVENYHKVCLELLNNIVVELKKVFNKYIFKPLIDDSPIPEVLTASICGLGVIGKNNLLINSKYGSWVFIGEIVSDIKLLRENLIQPKSCINCGKCIKSCPTGALTESSFDFQKCISYISQKKTDLNDYEINILKNSKSIWGCDICQEICPMNQNALYTNIPGFHKNIEPIIKIGDYDRLQNRAFHWRKKFVLERNLFLKQK